MTMTNTQYRPTGMVHTLVHMIVRDVEFVDERQVMVTATIGESESNSETVRFRMTHAQALAADIIEKA